MANNMEFNPKNWDWGSFNTYYSLVSGAITGYSFGNKVDNYFKTKSYSKDLEEFMRKRASNSDASFVSENNLQPFAVENYSNYPLMGTDIQELYGLSYEDFNALNPGTKVAWEKGEWFNVFPPKPSKAPFGFPPDPNRGFLLNKPCFFKQFNNLFFGNIFELALVVNVNQVNLVILGYKVSDNPGTARLTLDDTGNA